MYESCHDKIKKSVTELYKTYNDVRARHKKDLPFNFWDVVVLTASDEEQKIAYQMQVDFKMKNGEIPDGVSYYVFADPVGCKIGCGGAAMNAIYHLNKIYGLSLNQLYILIINAGGFSQRLPSSSALGKVFMALPYGSPMWSLFDLKLACYIPFIQRMKPGIFHTASDTIELFHLEESSASGDKTSDWNFLADGMTAIAHPSSIEIGTAHGVFVISHDECSSVHLPVSERPTQFLNCQKVLQKPSIEMLKENRALLKTCSKDREIIDFVYADSCFFFDHGFTDKLLSFYVQEMPLTCEIDGYGDFMQCLGPASDPTFASDFRNVVNVSSSLKPTREKLYDCLHSTKLNVIAFNQSLFFHLGTMKEYLDNFNSDGILADLIGWNKSTDSFVNSKNSKLSDKSVVIHSLLENTTIGNGSVIDYCYMTGSVSIGENNILSNCSCFESAEKINVTLSNLFIHTVPVKINDFFGFVTIIFNVSDDVKKVYNETDSVTYLGRTVRNFFQSSSLKIDDLFTDKTLNLWNARLFPCMPDMTSSFLSSLKLLRGTSTGFEPALIGETPKCLSACEVMRYKDVTSMLDYRRSLNIEIQDRLIKTNLN